MMVLRDPVNTLYIPETFPILKKFLPSVLSTECFNDQGIPFKKELKRTEVGHLFEHILLEYMCRFKIAKGYKTAAYKGRTRWNWERDPMGMFHININCTLNDADILPMALNKSIALMKIILKNERPSIAQTLPSLRPASQTKPDTLGLISSGQAYYDYHTESNTSLGLKNGKKTHNK